MWTSTSKPVISARVGSISIHCSYGALHWFSGLNWRRKIQSQCKNRFDCYAMSIPAWRPALGRKGTQATFKGHASKSYLSFLCFEDLFWSDSTAPGCGYQCFKQVAAFVRFCISPNLVKFGLYFIFRTWFLFLTLHIQTFSLSAALLALLSQVGSTDSFCLLSSPHWVCSVLHTGEKTTKIIQKGTKERISVLLWYLLLCLSVKEPKFSL